MDVDSAHRLLEKLRTFVTEELDEDERALFAALIAPAVARRTPRGRSADSRWSTGSPEPSRKPWSTRSAKEASESMVSGSRTECLHE